MGPARIMSYHWDWNILFRAPYDFWLLAGLWSTITLSLLGWVLALAVGTVVGVARSSGHPIAKGTAGVYVSIFRNIPLLLQMFVWFFVVPEIVPEPIGTWLKRGLPNPEFWTAVIALGFYTSGRLAEIFRSGIDAVPQGQRRAALAVGMSWPQMMRYVVLPQALRIVLPPLTSEFLSIVKNSSIAMTIGVLEITAQSRRIEDATFQGFEAFSAATVFYIAVAASLMAGVPCFEGAFPFQRWNETMLDLTVLGANAGFLADGLALSLSLTAAAS